MVEHDLMRLAKSYANDQQMARQQGKDGGEHDDTPNLLQQYKGEHCGC